MDSIKEIVRDKMRIEEVIGSYITLIPFGKNFKACCPFHSEKTPSFNVITDKQFYYCFGCKKGGDVFNFVQEIEHLDFKESLKLLAEKAGVDLRQSAELAQEMRQKKSLMQIHEYAARFYQLLLSKQQSAITYLHDRRITAESIKQWRIGYAPDGFGQLVTVLRKKGFSDTDLLASGLVGKTERGLYDRFRGRIMFPITDSQGNIIAFTGRVLPGTQEALRDVGKYINSPETMIYHKSTALYGFSVAKKSISECKQVIMVEGQFDAILSHQSGFQNTVAISGTACTDRHIEQLQRFATELVIATDSDRAGIQSAHKIAGLGYQFDCDVSVVSLPTGNDPADIIARNPQEWGTALQAKMDYLTFHGEITRDLSLRERIHSVEINIFPVLARMQNHVQRDAKLQIIADMLKVSIESIRKEFQKYLSANKFGNLPTPAPAVSVRELTHATPLEIQLQELALIQSGFSSETGFWFADHADAVAMINKKDIETTPEHAANIHVRYRGLDSVAWKIKLDTLWLRIQQLLLESQIDELRAQISNSADDQEIQTLQQKMLTLYGQRESLIQSLAE